MQPSDGKDRKTSIINDAVGLQEFLDQQGKKTARNKQKPASVFKRPKPQVTSGPVPKASHEVKATSISGQQVYEGHGLRIALHETHGKKRQQARTATTFRNKRNEELLNLVESYAGLSKKLSFEKEGKSKTYMANWIEMAETFAYGPSPRSKLKRKCSVQIW